MVLSNFDFGSSIVVSENYRFLIRVASSGFEVSCSIERNERRERTASSIEYSTKISKVVTLIFGWFLLLTCVHVPYFAYRADGWAWKVDSLGTTGSTGTRSNPNTSPYLDYRYVLPCLYKLTRLGTTVFAWSSTIIRLTIGPRIVSSTFSDNHIS